MTRIKIDIISIYILLLCGLFTGGLTSIIAVVYAYVRRSSVAGLPEEREYNDTIKIFWILFWISLIPFILIFFFFIAPAIGLFTLASLSAIFSS